MTTNYPGTLDNFTNPTPNDYEDVLSHAGQHSNANDAIESIESVLGTTSGSAILTSFTANQKALNYLGTPSIGDINYYNGTSWISLPAGTNNSNKYLKTDGTAPSWAQAVSYNGTPTAGDLLYYGTDTVWQTLAAGTASAGKYLTTDGTTPSWGTVSQGGGSDGWTAAPSAFTYLSGSTITTPGTAENLYSVGDRLRFVQGGTTKYFSVITPSGTVLTVTGGTEYTVANAAISSPYYSKSPQPAGYPFWLSHTITPTTSGGGTAPTFTGTNWCQFAQIGKMVRMTYQLENSSGGTPGSGGVDVLLNLPVPTQTQYVNNTPKGMSMWYNGTAQAFLLTQISGTTTFKMKKIATTFLQANDLNNAQRYVYGELTYEI